MRGKTERAERAERAELLDCLEEACCEFCWRCPQSAGALEPCEHFDAAGGGCLLPPQQCFVQRWLAVLKAAGRKLAAPAVAVLLLAGSGCMSDKEYRLRAKDIDAKKAWPATYQPLAIKGPLTVPEGGELVINVPNAPYRQTDIPDGQAYQLKALNAAMVTGGAITGGYFIKSAGGSTSTVNNTTVNGGTAP